MIFLRQNIGYSAVCDIATGHNVILIRAPQEGLPHVKDRKWVKK